MKHIAFSAVFSFLILWLLFSCQKEKDAYLQLEKTNYYFGDTLRLKNGSLLQNIRFNEKVAPYIILDSIQYKLGHNTITIEAQSQGENLSKTFQVKIFNTQSEIKIRYHKVDEYPHDSGLFTQGFMMKNDIIYETSGLYNQSKIVKYNLGASKFLNELSFDTEIFAEGLTYFDGHFYVLTWKEQLILKLNADVTQIIDKIPLPIGIHEGWGLSNDAQHCYLSNGTSTLFVLNQNFEIINRLEVVGHEKLYSQINELEYHDGWIYANLWHESKIIKINPNTGAVVGFIDLKDIAEQQDTEQEEVLNGIAFNASGDMLITGKRWNKIYAISLQE